MRWLLVLLAAALFLPAATAANRPVVVVAVVDSGVDAAEAYVDDLVVPGYNALDGTSRTNDEFGHGTEVAYQLGQALGFSSHGIGRLARLMPVKIAGASGNATSLSMATGIGWAADHGARVINVSYGPVAFAPPNELIQSAIQHALGRGATVILSAGNDGSGDPAVNKHVSGSPGAVGVAAVDLSDHLIPRSNHGSWVALAGAADSTSLAAPLVSAAATELLVWRPELTREDVLWYLRSGCHSVPSLDVAWHCVVDGRGALSAAGFVASDWASIEVTHGGDGAGAVTASGAAIDCGSSCMDLVHRGTRVTLTATPAAGSSFLGWSEGCTGSSLVCTVDLVDDLSVRAAFTRRFFALTVRTVGGGIVSGPAAGIACPTRCTARVPFGPVRLTARPRAGFRFVRWDGTCRGSRSVCVFQMSGPHSATARFAKRT